MIQYPLQFRVDANALSGVDTLWKTKVPGEGAVAHSLEAAIPREFEGPGGGYSPEDFYSLALMNCFIATFKVIGHRSKLEFRDLQGEGTLTVDRDEKGFPWMKAFHLKVTLNGAPDSDRARRLLEKASQSCLILNSVRTEKTFEFIVNE
jgi:uncharacterized OsmC-like protein